MEICSKNNDACKVYLCIHYLCLNLINCIFCSLKTLQVLFFSAVTMQYLDGYIVITSKSQVKAFILMKFLNLGVIWGFSLV